MYPIQKCHRNTAVASLVSILNYEKISSLFKEFCTLYRDCNIDYNLILEIAKKMTKNLLDKLNYKLDIVDYGNKKKLKIKNLIKND